MKELNVQVQRHYMCLSVATHPEDCQRQHLKYVGVYFIHDLRHRLVIILCCVYHSHGTRTLGGVSLIFFVKEKKGYATTWVTANQQIIQILTSY